jgi:protein-tyrosine phosphatase
MIHELDIPSALNLRDVGGHRTHDARLVRRGLVYRSGSLARLTSEDAARLVQMGIRTVYDLRSDAEREAQPDRLPEEIDYRVADVLGDSAGAVFGRISEIMTHPEQAARLLGDGQSLSVGTEQYRDLVRLSTARAAYGRLFRGIADPSVRPVLFHCSAGKDRTGWATAALLMLLDVPDQAVTDDYLRSAVLLNRFATRVGDAFAARGGDPELLEPILGVRTEYLDAARDEAFRCFGDVAGYFALGLDLDAAVQQTLRRSLLEPG